jgi:hypothetical protein
MPSTASRKEETMKRYWLLLATAACLITLIGAVTAQAQSRTTDRIISVAFSQLRTTDPNGSTRIVINGTPGDPCTVGVQQVLAVKLSGTWRCIDLTAGSTTGGGAPDTSTYILQTTDSSLTNSQALSLLSTGLLKNTGSSGVLSIAIPGTDFLAPNGNGSQLTSLDAAALTTGTIPDARFPFILPTASGANLFGLNAGALTTGTVNVARLGSGSGGATKFLREDSTWQTIPGGGDALTSGSLAQFAPTTSAQLAGVLTDESGSGPSLFGNSPTITTPTIGNFVNSQHTHTGASGGGQLTDAALSSAVGIAKGGTGQTTQTAAFNALDPLTTKGDLLSHDGTNSVRVAVGANGTCVKANSATSSGLEFGTCGVGTGDVTAAANFGIDNVAIRSDGTSKGVQASGVTIDDSDNIATGGTVSTGVGSSVAGNLGLFQGTATTIATNTIQIQAPTSVTGYNIVLPGAAASGIPHFSNSSSVITTTISGVAIADLTATGTPSSTTFLRGDNTWATPSGSGTVTATGGSLTSNAVVLGAGTTDTKVVAGITTNGTSVLNLGVAGSSVGGVVFGNATSGTITLQPTTGALGSTTLTLPNVSSTLSSTIASGTSVLGTSAISSGACATVVTTSATGTATTDVVSWGFNADPTSTTGYQASANGMLTIIAYPTANNVNFKVCNNTSASITPGAVTLNWRIMR